VTRYQSQRGRDRETKVGDFLEEQGWIVGSRRHRGGAGDLLAVWYCDDVGYAVWLIEVKSTAGGPYERFGPRDRQEMTRVARRIGAQPVLAYWPPRAKMPTFIHEENWPR
jgi:Holliday junction resolvase-like predicted endonuclease